MTISKSTFCFSHGMTLEMQIQLEQPDKKTSNPGGPIFIKMGSFYTTIKNNTFSITHMFYPTVPVATSTDKQYTFYLLPTGFPGSAALPSNRWVQIALTNDSVMKVARTFIDGKLYYTEYNQPEEAIPLPLQNKITSPLGFAYGMKNVRVGVIRVSKRQFLEAINPLNCFVGQH